MSPIRKHFLTPFWVLMPFCFWLAGCGDTHPEATFNTGTGQHVSGWLPSGHKAQAQANMEACADCHGADFLGGIAKVACTQCHLGNQNSFHPVQWGNFAYALHGNYARLNGTASCANVTCHGADLTGVAGSGPSCTQCHIGGITSFHPIVWNTNIVLHKDYVALNGDSSCRNGACHGANLQGVFLSGPGCQTCHPY
jgi:hypothetical protein